MKGLAEFLMRSRANACLSALVFALLGIAFHLAEVDFWGLELLGLVFIWLSLGTIALTFLLQGGREAMMVSAAVLAGTGGVAAFTARMDLLLMLMTQVLALIFFSSVLMQDQEKKDWAARLLLTCPLIMAGSGLTLANTADFAESVAQVQHALNAIMAELQANLSAEEKQQFDLMTPFFPELIKGHLIGQEASRSLLLVVFGLMLGGAFLSLLMPDRSDFLKAFSAFRMPAWSTPAYFGILFTLSMWPVYGVVSIGLMTYLFFLSGVMLFWGVLSRAGLAIPQVVLLCVLLFFSIQTSLAPLVFILVVLAAFVDSLVKFERGRRELPSPEDK